MAPPTSKGKNSQRCEVTAKQSEYKLSTFHLECGVLQTIRKVCWETGRSQRWGHKNVLCKVKHVILFPVHSAFAYDFPTTATEKPKTIREYL